MTNDLISRKDLIKAIEKAQFEGVGNIMAIVDDMPSIQNEPVCIAKVTFDEAKLKELTDKIAEQMRSGEIVLMTDHQPKKGKWIKNPDCFCCSVCGGGYKNQPTLMGNPLFEFCPMCGAKMEVNNG